MQTAEEAKIAGLGGRLAEKIHAENLQLVQKTEFQLIYFFNDN